MPCVQGKQLREMWKGLEAADVKKYVYGCNDRMAVCSVPMIQKHLTTLDYIASRFNVQIVLEEQGFKYGRGEAQRIHWNKNKPSNIKYRHDYIRNTTHL